MTKSESRLLWAALKWGDTWRKGTTASEVIEAEGQLLAAYDSYKARHAAASKKRRKSK